mgnify:CR=1 FL=1
MVTGRYESTNAGTERVDAFIPDPLHGAVVDHLLPDIQLELSRANEALGRLDGVTQLLPDPALFIYFYVRKEAVLSSQIEGTQSSLSDLLLFESHEVPGVSAVAELDWRDAAGDRGIRAASAASAARLPWRA